MRWRCASPVDWNSREDLRVPGQFESNALASREESRIVELQLDFGEPVLPLN
jgi:hypothetical protein